MKELYSLRKFIRDFLILLLVIVLILAPRPIVGELDLASAVRFDKAGQYTQAASAYISAVQRIPWLPTLWEKAGDAYCEKYFYCSDGTIETNERSFSFLENFTTPAMSA